LAKAGGPVGTPALDKGLDFVSGVWPPLPRTVWVIEDRRRTVVITRAGNGTAIVRPSVTPLDFDCGSGCYAFLPGTAVTFTLTPTNGSSFGGWSGACSSGGFSCTVTTPSTSPTPVAAPYTAIAPAPPPPPAPP